MSIKLSRFRDLWVGDISINGTALDRSKATSSNPFSFCVRNGWTSKCTNYTATNNPFISEANAQNPWWIIPVSNLGDISINTNADKMEILDVNNNVVATQTFQGRFSNNIGADPAYASYGQTVINYKADTIGVIENIQCRNNVSGNVQSCVKGSDNGCADFRFPLLDGKTGQTYWIEEPFKSLNLQGRNNNGKFVGWKIINFQACGYDTLPNGIKVSDKKVDNCMVTYDKCVGNNCYKKPDGSLFFTDRIVGCTDGSLTEWSPWKCSNGTSTRTRSCVQPLNGGKPCDPNAILKETIECSDAKMSDWSQWKCDGNGKSTRTRTCTPAKNGGAACDTLIETRVCVNAKMSDWGEWTCNNGVSTRSRTCTPPVNGGNPCEPLTETSECVDAKMSDWSEWVPNTFFNPEISNFSKRLTDSFYETRTRTCIPPIKGGQQCDINAVLSETQLSKTRIIMPIVIIILLFICSSSSLIAFKK